MFRPCSILRTAKPDGAARSRLYSNERQRTARRSSGWEPRGPPFGLGRTSSGAPMSGPPRRPFATGEASGHLHRRPRARRGLITQTMKPVSHHDPPRAADQCSPPGGLLERTLAWCMGQAPAREGALPRARGCSHYPRTARLPRRLRRVARSRRNRRMRCRAGQNARSPRLPSGLGRRARGIGRWRQRRSARPGCWLQPVP